MISFLFDIIRYETPVYNPPSDTIKAEIVMIIVIVLLILLYIKLKNMKK